MTPSDEKTDPTSPERGPLSEDEQLRERSDHVRCLSPLVSFLYQLMRDHVPPGVVEKIVRESPAGETMYTNGWLASMPATSRSDWMLSLLRMG